MNYTKGEWSVHELDDEANSLPPPLAELIPSPKPHGKKIQIVAWDAFCKLEPTEEDYEISRANAHLIAAAPMMYEALQGAKEWIDELQQSLKATCEDEGLEYYEPTEPCEMEIEIDKALAKAEGRRE